MKKETILKAISELRKSSKKRNFNQTFDLVINLRDVDIKNPNQKVDTAVELPFGRGKKIKLCALVGEALYKEAKENCDYVLLKDDFKKVSPKEVKKLVREHTYFIAQADIMPDVATAFGKILGPRGKMPSPKLRCIIPPKAVLRPICGKLQKTVRLQTKNEKIIKCPIGTEEMKDEEVADNILSTYNALVSVLHEHEKNISEVLLKMTMGKPIGIKEEK